MNNRKHKTASNSMKWSEKKYSQIKSINDYLWMLLKAVSLDNSNIILTDYVH